MRRVVHSALLACLFLFAPYLPAQQTVAERYLFAAANQDRAAHGLAPLRFDAQLAQAARLHAEAMRTRQTISHQFAGEAGLAERVAAAGVRFSTVTENVAEAPNAAEIDELWMASAGHRANLLDARVDTVGIAVVAEGRQFYAVEDFARSVAVLSVEAQERQVGALLGGLGLTLLPAGNESRAACVLDTGYAGLRRPAFTMRYTAPALDVLPAELSEQIATHGYRSAAVGACEPGAGPFTRYRIAVMLFR